MIKNIALLKRKEGLTRDQFIEYYETKHAPLILTLMPGIERYVRNFLSDEGNRYVFPNAGPIDFDVVTEIWLKDRAAYDLFAAEAAKPEVMAAISADEANFLDSSYTRMFVVEECASPIGG